MAVALLSSQGALLSLLYMSKVQHI